MLAGFIIALVFTVAAMILAMNEGQGKGSSVVLLGYAVMILVLCAIIYAFGAK